MEQIVPHRSTPRRHGGNHPFVWVSVCNDFSLLLPSDLHAACKSVCVCVCVVVCYCWTLTNEPSFHMSWRQKWTVLSPLMASSDWVFTSFWFSQWSRLNQKEVNSTVLHRRTAETQTQLKSMYLGLSWPRPLPANKAFAKFIYLNHMTDMDADDWLSQRDKAGNFNISFDMNKSDRNSKLNMSDLPE